ncbi:MAG: hypothetical protein GAK40_01243 [Burkholderia plantarii]|nr:MAG: hypothetical protein GAK40_01243 [Burkholderia plantarii]
MEPVQTRPGRPGARIGGRLFGRRRERGTFAVMTVICLTVMIVILGMLDIGNVFFQRRDMQRIADMAAMAGVQRMTDACYQAGSSTQTQATENATKNGLSTTTGDTITVTCGRWDPKVNAAPSYYATGAALTQKNAVQVSVTRNVPYFFLGPDRTVTAVSTARATNIDVFSVGATLASLGSTDCSNTMDGSPGLINNLLTGLLGGSGSNPISLTLLSYQGLACTTVKLGDLAVALQSLGVGNGTIGSLVGANVSLSNLLKAMISLVSKQSTANAQASLGALNLINTSILSNFNVSLASLSRS